jgi:solute carrier family 30 (zinc transporter), member 2
MKETAK